MGLGDAHFFHDPLFDQRSCKGLAYFVAATVSALHIRCNVCTAEPVLSDHPCVGG